MSRSSHIRILEKCMAILEGEFEVINSRTEMAVRLQCQKDFINLILLSFSMGWK
jgi:hypothetical protein